MGDFAPLCYICRSAAVPIAAVPTETQGRRQVSEATEQILAKNIWELEHRMKEGQGDSRTRLSLVRAYAQQNDIREEELGVAREDRSYLRVNDRSRDGVLLIHGSTGGPAQLRSLADVLHREGYSVYVLRMPGHPADNDELDTHGWRAWLSEAETRYRVLAIWCRKIHVVGFSFGASVALTMNVRPRPKSLVLLAPALKVKLNFLAQIALRLGLHQRDWFRRRLGWRAEVLDGIDTARRTDWWESLPVYAAICDDDSRVDRGSLKHIGKHSSHPATTLRRFPKGGHVFMDEEPASELRQEILEFLKKD